jgi:hypothetical protein
VVNKVSNSHKTIGKITVPIFVFFFSLYFIQLHFPQQHRPKTDVLLSISIPAVSLELLNGIFKAKLKSNRHKASPSF